MKIDLNMSRISRLYSRQNHQIVFIMIRFLFVFYNSTNFAKPIICRNGQTSNKFTPVNRRLVLVKDSRVDLKDSRDQRDW